jgi:inorganic triphosphatase YgiF
VFTTEFDRNVAVVEPAAGTNVEVCVDQGTIIAGRRRQAVCEIELELKKGELALLFDLARQLATIPGVRIETDSKALRGYRIATQTRPTPVKAGTISLPAEPSIDSLFTMLAFECMAQLQRNEQGILRTRDIEYLHQARVALRRLRSVFGVFSAAIPTNHFSDQLDWLRDLGRRLGQARDWDVFTADFLPTASSRIKDNAAFAGVMRKAARLRSGARRRVDEALRNPDYPVQMLLLTQKLHEQKWGAQRSIEQRETASSPVTAFAASVLERAHRKVIKQGKHMDWTSSADLHKLRIRIKKLRYSSELLSPLFKPKDARKFLSRLTKIQDVLGRLNDAATAVHLAGQINPDTGKLENAEIIAYLKGYAHAQSHFSITAFEPAWKKFKTSKIFW